jgi:hypothetical protein
MTLSIWRNGGTWQVWDTSGALNNNVIHLMDGTKGGGDFKTFEEAEAEVERVFRYMETELTRKEIIRHFTLKWIRREEQADELLAFRQALLNKDYKSAQKIYSKKLSNFSRQAIPNKVCHQISLHI